MAFASQHLDVSPQFLLTLSDEGLGQYSLYDQNCF
ncbi:hypothetical protein LF1_13650 [Rubripirellula obstinata]|uniref:Uncharacterized protein n=1 Tax=Rubripirellula obstinata TaxID=406547 RepID=A0A5B1CF44_9BACT|nr:hypothetical protein LF1_13650 [Rubripirellula obstinata]